MVGMDLIFLTLVLASTLRCKNIAGIILDVNLTYIMLS